MFVFATVVASFVVVSRTVIVLLIPMMLVLLWLSYVGALMGSTCDHGIDEDITAHEVSTLMLLTSPWFMH